MSHLYGGTHLLTHTKTHTQRETIHKGHCHRQTGTIVQFWHLLASGERTKEGIETEAIPHH